MNSVSVLIVTKPASEPRQTPTMDTGNGSESGGVHFELLHGVSFGSGALVILMFVALYYLRLRWKKEKRTKTECNNCNPQNNSQQMNRSCVIEIPRRSMDIAATDVSETTFSETTMRDFQNFLTFSRMMNSPPIMDNSDRPTDRYIVK